MTFAIELHRIAELRSTARLEEMLSKTGLSADGPCQTLEGEVVCSEFIENSSFGSQVYIHAIIVTAGC